MWDDGGPAEVVEETLHIKIAGQLHDLEVRSNIENTCIQWCIEA